MKDLIKVIGQDDKHFFLENGDKIAYCKWNGHNCTFHSGYTRNDYKSVWEYLPFGVTEDGHPIVDCKLIGVTLVK